MTDDEMIRLIAERLMEWKETTEEEIDRIKGLKPPCFYVKHGHLFYYRHSFDYYCFSPLHNDMDAMMVFDKMAERDHISLYVTNYGKMWVCETGRCTDKMHIYSKQPFTPEGRRRAICEAAVQMVQG